MNQYITKLSWLHFNIYKEVMFKNDQVLWFNYMDMSLKCLTIQPLINFLIKYFRTTNYTEIGISVGTNFFLSCGYIEYSKIPCSAHGISLYDVPIEKIGDLKNDHLLTSRNLEKNNRFSFARISKISADEDAIDCLDKSKTGLIVLNQITDFQVEKIGHYYQAICDKSILLVFKHLIGIDPDALIGYIKSNNYKYLETPYAVIIFKNFNDRRDDLFIEEFDALFSAPLNSIMRFLIEKARLQQKVARTKDIFNLGLLKPTVEKHFFSVIGLFRNESLAMKEWLEHYLRLGVDHFYMVDNKSTDNYYEILRPYIERGLVSLYFCDEEKYQLGILRELTNILKNETTWVGAFDLDEFIYPPYERSISSVIRKFESYEAIVIPWLIYGSNGHLKQPSSIVQGFTKRMRYNGEESHVKSIVKTSAIKILTQHVPWTLNDDHILSDGRAHPGRLTKIRLYEKDIPGMELLNNHYILQSEELFRKVKAGRTEVAENFTGKKDMAYFYSLDKKANEITDERLAIKEKDEK